MFNRTSFRIFIHMQLHITTVYRFNKMTIYIPTSISDSGPPQDAKCIPAFFFIFYESRLFAAIVFSLNPRLTLPRLEYILPFGFPKRFTKMLPT